MVHPKVLAAAPYRTSRVDDVLLGLAGLGLALGGLCGVAGAGLLLSAVFPPAALVMASLYTTGLVIALQAFVLSVPAVGLLALVLRLSRGLR